MLEIAPIAARAPGVRGFRGGAPAADDAWSVRCCHLYTLSCAGMGLFSDAIRRAVSRQGTPENLAGQSREAQRVLDDVVTITIIAEYGNGRKARNLASIQGKRGTPG